MGMRDNINAEWGIVKFLGEKRLVSSGRRGEINRVLVGFLEEYNLPIKKHNPRYRGIYDALNSNCITVQENWVKFHNWCNKKVKENDTNEIR